MHVRSSAAAALIVSVAIHAGVGVSLEPPWEDGRPTHAAHAREPSARGPAALSGARALPVAQPLAPGVKTPASNIDSERAEGRSAEAGGSLVWIQSLPVPSDINLRDADLNNAAASQVQRIDTASTRATQENRRATPHPAEAVFLASGSRGPQERLPESARWPERGALHAQGIENPSPAQLGDTGRDTDAHASAPAHAFRKASQALEAGAFQAKGSAAQHRAPRAFARPSVDPAHAATPAETKSPLVRDTEAAELLAAALQRSIVDATRLRNERADKAGAGVMTSAENGIGRAGKGVGSHAESLKPGPGELGLLDTRDSRYLRWFGLQRARVAEHLTFPQGRALAMDQGQTLVFVRVLRSGQFAASPSLYRSSGFAEFDAAALAAVRNAGAFSPLPDEILPGAEALSLLLPVRFDNPMVR